MLDRFLILAELQGLPARIAANKIDLDDPAGHAAALFCPYTGAYPVHEVSARTGAGLPELRAALAGRVTAVAGPSGVGKSSLLNTLHPEGDRAVGDISEATGKGRHTTTAARLYEIGPDTFVADTPGMRALAMHAVDADRLPSCFPEFRPYLDHCLYPDCTHVSEPGCAVREAVEVAAIPHQRYESYAALRAGDEVRQ
jgi:ribosome biogenesis GTPase